MKFIFPRWVGRLTGRFYFLEIKRHNYGGYIQLYFYTMQAKTGHYTLEFMSGRSE